MQKWLGKTGIEFHWPGYQYMGPGTNLKKRLARGDPGNNRLDKIAKQHDINYINAKTLKDKHAADKKMVNAIRRLTGRKTYTETIVKGIMKGKLALGKLASTSTLIAIIPLVSASPLAFIIVELVESEDK